MFAVLFLDLDRFKVINDSLGHTMGDEVLIASARRLQACVRAIDTVARLGGDEFIILLEEIQDVSEPARIADRIQSELAIPICQNGHQAVTTASIGIVLSTEGYDCPEDILRDGDIAMYRAKAGGKARYELFNTDMRIHAVTRLGLENDLRQALVREEFRLHYQPIMALDRSCLIGFEALLRWRHPERGPVPPDEFIPVAEETGLIVPIGQWVLREACQQLQVWQARFPKDPPLTVSVNLSSRQLEEPALVEQIEQILRETGLSAGSLKLEITERAIIENTATTRVVLSRLKEMGVQVQMDDFGTGYSSLSHLIQFPIDTIKIGRAFVSKMGRDGEGVGIVQTIVFMARELAMNVIAEGIETEEQLAQLQKMECE